MTWKTLGCFLALSLCATLYQTRAFYFFSDDFLNFVIASDMGLTKTYLLRDLFGQFVPLYRFLNYAYLRSFGVVFWPFRVMLVLFHWIMLAAVFRLGSERRLPSFWLLVALAFIGFSPVFATTQQWWSAALSVLTETAAISVVLIIQLRGPTLSRGDNALAVLLFTVALAVYPKTLVTIIPMVSTRLFARGGRRGDGILKPVVGSLADLWPIIVVALIYVYVVASGGYSDGVKRPSASVILAFILRGWNRGYLCNVIGAGYDSGLAPIALNAIVLAVVGILIARRPRTAILWGGFAAYFLVSTGLIAWNRAVPFGLDVAETGRYYTDTLCFFIIFAIAAYDDRIMRISAPVRQPSVLQAVMACVVSGALIRAADGVPHLWYAGPEMPAAFVANLKSGLRQAGGARLLNQTMVVPGYVMPAWMWPLNQFKYFDVLFEHRPVTSGDGRAVYVREDGTVTITGEK